MSTSNRVGIDLSEAAANVAYREEMISKLRNEMRAEFAVKLEQQLAGRTNKIRTALNLELTEARLYLDRSEPNVQGALNRLADMRRILDNGI